MIIWVCKVYVVKSKSGNKSLDPRTSTDLRKASDPMSTEIIPYQDDGYFMVY